MRTNRFFVPAFALLLTGAAFTPTAFATPPESTPPATTPRAPASDEATPQRATGVVKSIDLAKQQVVVTIDGTDRTFEFADIGRSPDVDKGARVDVTYVGDVASEITLHK